LEYNQLPSFLTSQAKGVLPIPVQNGVGFLAGEMDGFDALTKSVGLMTSSTHPKKTGVSPYWDKIAYASGNTEERKKQFESALNRTNWVKQLPYYDLLPPNDRRRADRALRRNKRGARP